jgi:hypothetical protein
MFTMPFIDVPLHCVEEAAVMFHVPESIIISVLLTERGKIGEISKNKNSTYDIGLMQINSSQLNELKKYNITESDLKYNACINVKVGTWILAKKIANGKNLATGIGDYNSHTYHFNKRYYKLVETNFTKLNNIVRYMSS